METIIIYVIIIVVTMVIRSKKKGNKSNSAGQPKPNVPRPNLQTARKTTSQRVEQFKYRTTHADENYDDHLLDYCDSDLPTTRGISFKDVPSGGDELLYLRRFNRQREKQLEHALQNQEQSITSHLN